MIHDVTLNVLGMLLILAAILWFGRRDVVKRIAAPDGGPAHVEIVDGEPQVIGDVEWLSLKKHVFKDKAVHLRQGRNLALVLGNTLMLVPMIVGNSLFFAAIYLLLFSSPGEAVQWIDAMRNATGEQLVEGIRLWVVIVLSLALMGVVLVAVVSRRARAQLGLVDCYQQAFIDAARMRTAASPALPARRA